MNSESRDEQNPSLPSQNDDEESLKQRKLDDDSQSSTSHRLEELTDSLRALPDRISRMEEQWRDTLKEIQRFTTHSDARMGDIRLELLDVKKLALRDNDSVRDMATEAKFQTDVQAVDMEAVQKKLCRHDDQLRIMEEQIQKNDVKHQTSYEKLMDSMNVMNDTQERILTRLDQELMSKRKRSRSPVIPRGPADSATFIREKPTQIEHKVQCSCEGDSVAFSVSIEDDSHRI